MTTTPRTRGRIRRPATSVAVAVALALGAGACSSEGSGSTSTSTPSATASPGASGSTSSSTSSAAGALVLPTEGVTAGSGDVVSLAQAFADTLDEDQLASLQQEYTFENATAWSNLPANLGGGGAPAGGSGAAPSGAPDGGTPPSGEMPTGGMPGGAGGGGGGVTRVGLQTDALSEEQQAALAALLAAATGSGEDEGYDEIVQHLAADEYLSENGGGDAYGSGQFFVAFLGEPSDSGTWELQFGGHHLAVANTYVDGELGGATPSFRGIEPFETVTVDDVTVEPEQQEAAAFAALLASLDEDQLAAAELDSSYNDLLLGPGNDWAFPEAAEGIAGSELDDDQRALLLAAIDTYVGDLADEDAAAVLATYESQLDDTYVSWSGTTSMTEVGDYVRIDGPRVWVEFSMQNGIVLQGAHPHAVWRDKETDYAGTTA